MHILSLENKAFSLTNLPDELEDDIRFAILDNSDPKQPLSVKPGKSNFVCSGSFWLWEKERFVKIIKIKRNLIII